jgi:cobalamin-dependent methionine synthase I
VLHNYHGFEIGQADNYESSKRPTFMILYKMGFPPQDIIFDLIFPVATGMEEHR